MVVRIAVEQSERARPMRAGVRIAALVVLAATATGGFQRAWALDAHANGDSSPLQIFKNPIQALEQYREDALHGDSASSLAALRYAADGGQALAQWKLGSMYQTGEGVPQNDIKAYDYFSRIVANYDEDRSDWRQSSVVSCAFVAIGVYSLSGIPDSKVHADPARALEMFHYAATTFGDPNAQYNLARMYLDGVSVKRDPQQAARWLNLAADKGHKDAQALLGNLLFHGDGAVQRQRALGLMYLTLAREAAVDPKKDGWIIDLHDSALRAATDDEKGMARHYLEKYVSRGAGGLTAER
jgi:TPR repeat protein